MPDPIKNEAEQPLENGEAATPQQTSGTSLRRKLAAAGLIAAVVLVECGIAYLFIPGATADAQPDAAVLAAESALAESKQEKKEDEEEEIEIDIGEFSVTSYQMSSNTTYRVNFHLYCIVSGGEKEEFAELKEANVARLREQVNVIVRAAETPDLADPTLALIKRRILDKINRILGKQIVKDVIFSDMLFVAI